MSHQPQAAQQEIIDDFQYFDDWLDRYQYLIDLGKKLPELSEDEKQDQFLLHGCQSRVWLHMGEDTHAVDIRANSDAAIVSGLIALVLKVYSGASARQILETEPLFVEAIGLKAHLSPTRSNGLHSMLQAIKAHAAKLLAN